MAQYQSWSVAASVSKRTVVDLRGNFVFVNDAFCRTFGHTKEKATKAGIENQLKELKDKIKDIAIVRTVTGGNTVHQS